jgi:hypothetical protein
MKLSCTSRVSQKSWKPQVEDVAAPVPEAFRKVETGNERDATIWPA